MDVVTTSYPKEIAEAVAKVMGADLYVQKRGKNAFHGYKYATVGDLLDKLQPLMAEAGLIVFQHECSADMLDNGNVMVIRYQFTLAHTSGAVWPEKPVHTGMSACRNTKGGFDDKAANKCHTAARKYFLLGLFQVPTGEDYRESALDGDADAQDHAPPMRSQTNGATRTASAPPPPAPRAVNTAALPPNPEESAEVTAARQRIRMLIDQYAHRIRTAPNAHALELVMDDGRDDLAEIEAAGEAGKLAAVALRGKFMARRAEFEEKAA